MLTPEGFKDKRAVAVLGSWGSGWDRAVFLFLDFIGAYGIFNKHVKYENGYI